MYLSQYCQTKARNYGKLIYTILKISAMVVENNATAVNNVMYFDLQTTRTESMGSRNLQNYVEIYAH